MVILGSEIDFVFHLLVPEMEALWSIMILDFLADARVARLLSGETIKLVEATVEVGRDEVTDAKAVNFAREVSQGLSLLVFVVLPQLLKVRYQRLNLPESRLFELIE